MVEIQYPTTPTSAMVALSLFALLASASLAVAGPAGSRFGVHESRASAPEGFAHVGPAPTGQLLSMRLNLRMNDIEGLENALNAASDPKSATFRQWLTKEQVSTPPVQEIDLNGCIDRTSFIDRDLC